MFVVFNPNDPTDRRLAMELIQRIEGADGGSSASAPSSPPSPSVVADLVKPVRALTPEDDIDE